MQEDRGMIEKGAPLWDYGITGASGVYVPFTPSPESGIMPGFDKSVDLTEYGVYPRMAADRAPGTRVDSYENLKRINMGLSPHPPDYDRVPALLSPGTTCVPKNYMKILRRELRRGELKLETDKDCDFVGRAADL